MMMNGGGGGLLLTRCARQWRAVRHVASVACTMRGAAQGSSCVNHRLSGGTATPRWRAVLTCARHASSSSSVGDSGGDVDTQTLFVSTRQEVVDALSECSDMILDQPAFIASVQYFDPEEALQHVTQDNEDSNGDSNRVPLGYSAEALAAAGAEAQQDAQQDTAASPGAAASSVNRGWHLSEDGPLTRFIVGVAQQKVADDDGSHHTAVEEVLDVVLPAFAGETLLEQQLRQHGTLGVWRGEVDALGLSSWQYGFVKHHTLAFFNTRGVLAEVGQHAGEPVLFLNPQQQQQEQQEEEGQQQQQQQQPVSVLPLADIADVRVRLAEEAKTLAVFTADQQEIPILRDDAVDDIDATDEGQVMIASEWMVKAAGSLVALLRQYGHTAQLRLPRVLLQEHNARVAARNKGWKDALKAPTTHK
ncbi:hypothetical protein PTSG_06620 [Salpingoeca rosetta]|uniref:Uncharacterized protein n=1 Tax=Salpingoeca rosetta (strain ATCC 50818 / BSB-021) TaxID=946362 RepID=F2UFI2_SALR5|nr:uncharacterized protein PTSG_06620 [Salpingoeca rosetta]EGD75550.1 hypothetical protein PTSG_06620 [Salpingoeca rosetta]|eukprot:XP_004992007.1 hypothetical protein PTSG_06620 [Salpingoeca rosetta]